MATSQLLQIHSGDSRLVNRFVNNPILIIKPTIEGLLRRLMQSWTGTGADSAVVPPVPVELSVGDRIRRKGGRIDCHGSSYENV